MMVLVTLCNGWKLSYLCAEPYNSKQQAKYPLQNSRKIAMLTTADDSCLKGSGAITPFNSCSYCVSSLTTYLLYCRIIVMKHSNILLKFGLLTQEYSRGCNSAPNLNISKFFQFENIIMTHSYFNMLGHKNVFLQRTLGLAVLRIIVYGIVVNRLRIHG